MKAGTLLSSKAPRIGLCWIVSGSSAPFPLFAHSCIIKARSLSTTFSRTPTNRIPGLILPMTHLQDLEDGREAESISLFLQQQWADAWALVNARCLWWPLHVFLQSIHLGPGVAATVLAISLFHVTYYDTATGFIINVCPSSPSKILNAAPSFEFLQWFLFS